MSNFHVGQKVVCVKRDSWKPMYSGESAPVWRGVYTIRNISMGDDGKAYLMFDEIKNPHIYRIPHPEARFRSIHFRPVVTRKTDISIFKAMLNPQNLRTDA